MSDGRLIPSAPQEAEAYLTWHTFHMPGDSGSQLAVAVPKNVGVAITSLYTLLLEWMVINSYNIALGILVAYLLKKPKSTPSSSNSSLIPTIWNKRWSLVDSAIDVLKSLQKDKWRGWKMYIGVLVLVGVLAFQIAVSILIPQFLLLDTAAPVNPKQVVILADPGDSIAEIVRNFQQKVPAALRAASVARVAPDDLWKTVKVRTPEELGKTDDGELIQRITYEYLVRGKDLGLQNATSLSLAVTGACTTEYGWLSSSNDSTSVDTYTLFGDPEFLVQVSPDDSLVPTAVFFVDEKQNPEGQTNVSWAMVVSSVGRLSFSEGNDPLYKTGPTNSDDSAIPKHQVLAGRPILSCWEEDIWSYKGQNGTVYGLSNTDSQLQNLFLPEPLSDLIILENVAPRITTIGLQLTSGALQSALATIGGIFDAERSSFLNDLKQLVRTTYIATANTLSESTLHPPTDEAGRSAGERNIALDQDNEPREGTGHFVIFTPDVATFSITTLALIPCLALFLYGLKAYILNYPLKHIKTLDAEVLHKQVLEMRLGGATMDESLDLDRKSHDYDKALEAGLGKPTGKGDDTIKIQSRPVTSIDE